jgi:hypothetical protein
LRLRILAIFRVPRRRGVIQINSGFANLSVPRAMRCESGAVPVSYTEWFPRKPGLRGWKQLCHYVQETSSATGKVDFCQLSGTFRRSFAY